MIWVDGHSGFVALSRADSPAQWRRAVETDEPIVTQVDDGRTPPGQVGLVPTSSCSKPSVVARMLGALDVQPGHRVLEVGTGTGWNTALLADRVGPDGLVVTIEADEQVARTARLAFEKIGHRITAITGDGARGWAPDAPYDRLIATASVHAVPPPWLDQVRPGGRLVLPFGTDYCNGAMLTLDRAADGSANGTFGGALTFMRLRGQRNEFIDPTTEQLGGADRGTTPLRPGQLFEMIAFQRAAFTIGLRVPRCYLTVEEDARGPRRHTIELHDTASGSWARVEVEPGGSTSPVRQFGSRRLWTEAEAAYAWWRDAGQPEAGHYRLTVTPDGTHLVELDGRRWAIT
ncbi:methyltransferase domain-containing protein [Amycolatopsis cihanbeyliensis]|uniref:methyltransferase domain-containing protein n=1 Tax=Amycolatopsis cihanbeyliensis TaxID=1128664 RepID=UPI001154B1B9|nr:methyltransferase domain-containing protein [Amycolatopsis cihanbeyliensis]